MALRADDSVSDQAEKDWSRQNSADDDDDVTVVDRDHFVNIVSHTRGANHDTIL